MCIVVVGGGGPAAQADELLQTPFCGDGCSLTVPGYLYVSCIGYRTSGHTENFGRARPRHINILVSHKQKDDTYYVRQGRWRRRHRRTAPASEASPSSPPFVADTEGAPGGGLKKGEIPRRCPSSC